MTLYSVYEPPSEAQDLEDRADSLVFVKEGFSWPALFVPGFWLLYRCMWLELVLFLGLFLVLGWVFGPSDAGQTMFGSALRLCPAGADAILLTHWHHDHSDAAGELARRLDCPVRSVDETFRVGERGLTDGDLLEAGPVAGRGDRDAGPYGRLGLPAGARFR